MRKYLLRILLFLSIVGCLDFLFGYYCRSLQSKALYGNNHDIYHIANNANEDIIIMGSSRCHHHFVPGIISDSLGMSCFNAGCDGNGIIYQYGLLQLMLRTHIPKVIIYDFYPNFDIDNNDNARYINNLKPYAHEACLKELFDDVNPYEKFKTLSSFYVFNTNFVQLCKDSQKKQMQTYNGYQPCFELMNYEPKVKNEKITIDSIKQKYFHKFITLCKEKNIKFLITFSPFYKSQQWGNLEFLYKMCEFNDVKLMDYYSSGLYNNKQELFKDPSHLNDTGARMFSAKFASDLKRILSK